METYSDDYPKILKLQGVILYPHDITEVEKKDNENNLVKQYRYNLMMIPDRGQQINNYALFKKQNYKEIRKALYGTWSEQLDMMYHGTWMDHITAIRSAVPEI